MKSMLNRLLAPLVFWIGRSLFHSGLGRGSEKKHHRVMKLLRFAADSGYGPALSLYGHLLHFRGDGIQNRVQGGIYLQQAAEQGDQKAQYQMGRIFEAGYEHYFQPDPSQALRYYRKAAEQHHQLAVNRLIQVFEQGELGEAANASAAEYWRQQKPALEHSAG
ncbi:tetratricopeptide repeat protein [Pontibacter sp. JAM-7]|uniref:tetratricopeptide repeat protein n=1 Tax=Pontibacter sp. JAM-7 TaxID=3366581 RepID=UPI003AF4D2E3